MHTVSPRLFPVSVQQKTASLKPVQFGTEPPSVRSLVRLLDGALQRNDVTAGPQNNDVIPLTVGAVNMKFNLTVPNAMMRQSTAPLVYRLDSLSTGEAIVYTGPGCFSIEKAAYRSSADEAFRDMTPEQTESIRDVIFRLAQVSGVSTF